MKFLLLLFTLFTSTCAAKSAFQGIQLVALVISTCSASFLRDPRTLDRKLQSLPTLDDIILTNPDLTTLAAAFQTAELDGVLATTFNFTTFAPNNAAFTAVDQEFLATLLTPSWILHLKDLLTFHITFPTVDRLLSTEYIDGQIFDMLNNEAVTANDLKRGIILSSPLTNSSTIIDADILASNGAVQIIDTVLSPGFFGVDVFGLGDQFTEFTILQELIDVVGLRGIQGEFTVLAPTNEAFEALGNETLAALKADPVALGKILSNHVIVGVYPSVFLENGLVLESIGDLNITVTISEASARQIAATVMFNDASVLRADILAVNGIAHAIDMVLFDPDPTSDVPSETPSNVPSDSPSDAPSDAPSDVPSASPTFLPTISMLPSDVPSTAPSFPPSESPSNVPSSTPSDSPSDVPTEVPSQVPSDYPSTSPSSAPSSVPSNVPSTSPSDVPSEFPSDSPSDIPSASPSDSPSDQPSDRPTTYPSAAPSSLPSESPAVPKKGMAKNVMKAKQAGGKR